MNPVERTRWVCERARGVGFDLCGVASVDTRKNDAVDAQLNGAVQVRENGHAGARGEGAAAFRELEYLPEWLARGYGGEMNYLRDPRRADPRLALEGARSVIVVALNYNAPLPRSIDQGEWAAEIERTRHARVTTERAGDSGTQHAGGEAKESAEDGAASNAREDAENGAADHAEGNWSRNARVGARDAPESSAANRAKGNTGYAEDETPRGWISRYAWGDDYHEVLREKLNALVAAMRAEFPEPFEARAYVDTGPVIERVAAKYAGLGWLAKNTFLINQQLGSWLFLGVILTTMELAPSLAPGEAPAADLCGSCTRCLDACPTQAFPQPYVLDARRCISYLTIELRGAIPEELRAGMGSAAIGCDICQDVCPWNRKAPVTRLAAFQPREVLVTEQKDAAGTETGESLFAPELEWLASLSQEEFSAAFRGSAVKRAKWRGLVRNACVALGNARLARDSSAHARVMRLLERLASGEDALIAEHARWALARLVAGEDSSIA